MRRQNGFTLIELLVVVSIIALLTAILAPALYRARQAAVNVRCIAQLHQLTIAIHMYATDNYQKLFWRLPNPNANGMEWYSWVGRETGNPHIQASTDIFNTTIPRPLNTYIQNTIEIARDPGDTYQIKGAAYTTQSWFDAVGSSYAFNAVGHPLYYMNHPYASVSDNWPGGLRGRRLTRIHHQSSAVLFLDSGLIYSPDEKRNWHLDGMANMAFCDGHVVSTTLPTENPYYGGDNEGIYWDAKDF